MKQPLNLPGMNSSKFILTLAVGSILVILLIAASFGFAASQEERDSFCASCHSQPELTYYQRSTGGQVDNLATYHTSQGVRCIDCHSGQGVSGRAQAELLGARNAALWFSGTAAQPAQRNFPIDDANCLKCHQDVTRKGYTSKEQISTANMPGDGAELDNEEVGGLGHYHQNLNRWQNEAPKNAGSCVSCHTGHLTGPIKAGFMSVPTVRETCDNCHNVLWQDSDH